jgi:hypothetical protein
MSEALRRVVRFALLPAAFYFCAFALLTFPLLGDFGERLFGDGWDGLQSAWGVWWIDHAVRALGQFPWHVSHLEHPAGVSLLAINAHPFDGLVALLLPSLSLVERCNTMVVFGFVAGGVTAFWLAHEASAHYLGSLFAGAVFTFSSFHFAHAEGHMQLVALEWIPLFALCAWRFTREPTAQRAVALALAWLLVLLCDNYYFLFCGLFALLAASVEMVRSRDVLCFFRRGRRGPTLVFLVTAALACGPLVLSLLALDRADPLQGAHDPAEFSLDALALVIPGGHWRLASLTAGYWSKLPGNIHESSVNVGLATLALASLAATRRGAGLWVVTFAVFALCALGPSLQVWGRHVPWLPMPYRALERAIPPLALAGCPVRMVVMVQLAASVLAAMGVRQLWQRRGGRIAFIALAVLAGVEVLPRPVPSSQPEMPEVYRALLRIPEPGALIDLVTPPPLQEWWQTFHHRPMAFGYLARTPTSIVRQNRQIAEAASAGRWAELACRFRLRFLIAPARIASLADAPRRVAADGEDALFDLARACPR